MRIPVVVGALFALGSAAACGGGAVQVHRETVAGGADAYAVPGVEVEYAPLQPDSASMALLTGRKVALITHRGWRPPSTPLSPAVKAAMTEFLRQGGQLLLFGYASRLVAELGIEPHYPTCEPFRWGFDARAVAGRAELGLRLVSGRADPLAEGLQAVPGHEHSYWLGGGDGVIAPLCHFTADPSRGDALARLQQQRDDRIESLDDVVLARWTVGAGSVLACGLLPELQSTQPAVAANARAFVHNVVRTAFADRRKEPLLVLELAMPAVPPPVAAMPPLSKRELPAAPLLAHWGIEVPLAGFGGEPPAPDDLVRDVLLPAWRAGADLVDLDLEDPTRGWPLAWRSDDPLQPPREYRGAHFWPRWGDDGVGAFCAEAHSRGMLVQASGRHWPVQGNQLAPQLAGLRFLGRELADQRGRPAQALDGFALLPAFADRDGLAVQMLQDFAPGAHVLQRGAQWPVFPGGVAMLDADDGALKGAHGSGISAQWRDGFPADLFPHGRLDCRALAVPGHGGGGSTGDWIATQANDFVRQRLGRGAALVWRGQQPAALAEDTLDYVYGVSLDPLRAAIAARFAATGAGGSRDAERSLLPAAPAGYGAESGQPAQGHFVQNNHLRLCGTGGNLLWDPQGLALFRAGEAVLLAKELFRTRLFGGRPDAAQLKPVAVDFLAGGARGPGGYDDEVRIGVSDAGQARPPQILAFAAAPQWPQRAAIELQLPIGTYELTLELRAVQGRGLVTVALDGEPLHWLPFAEGQPVARQQLPLPLALPGRRILMLSCADSGQVAIDALAVQRTADLAAEASIGLRAGHVASAIERSASTYHAETADVVVLADQPGFLWRNFTERAVRSLQVERLFDLRLHKRLLACGRGDGDKSLRDPFVLGADEPGVPALAVVPLQFGRYDHFELRGGQLVLKHQPEPRSHCKVGFYLLADGDLPLLPHLVRLFASLDQPSTIELGNQGEATISSDLPMAWTRLLRVQQTAHTPYMVRENGWWLLRGAQPMVGGGDWLRIVHLPGDDVQIVGGPATLSRTRPGPGSARTVALRDVEVLAATARVLQSGLQPPSVTFAADFDEVTIDGKAWSWFEGRTVCLPSRPGTYRVVATAHGTPPRPHLMRTRAHIDLCAFNPRRSELGFVARAGDDRPSDTPYTAWIAGPEPIFIEGAERVAESEFRFADPTHAAAAAGAGILIRFRPGFVKVRYVD